MPDFVSIVIPAYNEEKNISRIGSELLPVLRNMRLRYEVLVVDDGSKDRTYETAKKISGPIRVLRHQKNMGLGAAVRTGFSNAKGNIIIFLDADFTFHPREIPKLIKKYEEGNYDCVVGTQFGKGSKTRMQFHRKVLSRGVNKLYTVALGQNITAMSSIFRLYKKSAMSGISMKSNDFDICAEILFDMIKKKRKIAEVPVTLTTRKYGESKINNTREIKNHMKLLSKILAWRISG